MPSSIMDQRRMSPFSLPSDASSFFSEELHFPAVRRLWKPDSVTDHHHCGNEGISMMPGSKSLSSPLSELHLLRANPAEFLQNSQLYNSKDQKVTFSFEHPMMVSEKMALSNSSTRTEDYDSSSQFIRSTHPASAFVGGNRAGLPGSNCENGLFSSSLSDIFDKRLTLSSTNGPIDQSSDAWNSNFEEDEHFKSMEEIEAETIGDLLPDDDDLLSGIIDDIGHISRPNSGDEVDDDIFYSGGGMELEADDIINGTRFSDLSAGEASDDHQGGLNGPPAREHPSGVHPSRTLFVRNINSNIEDAELKVIFEQYGDIRTLYTSCKNRGFVIISYYDLRSACDAMRALQNKPLRHRKLDIHFSIPKDNPSEKDINQGTLVVFNLDASVSNDDLHQIFAVYGEIKEIRETPHKHDHKFIEYYDVRAAETALRALNRSDIAGKKITIEPSRPGGVRRCSLIPQLSPKLEQNELNGYSNNSLSRGFRSLPLGDANGIESGISSLNSALRAPISPFVESTFNGISTSVPQNLSSPVRITPVGNHIHNNKQAVHGDLSRSLAQMTFGYQGLPNFHAHSLPEYHNGVANGIPYTPNSTSAMGVGININSRSAEGIESRNAHNLGSDSFNSQSFDHSEGAFGVPGNGSSPILGNQYIWNNLNAFHRHPPGPLQWSNSPSFMNDISSHASPHMHGMPRAPSHMQNTVLPLQHHVGSAPAVNPSVWDRRHMYATDSTDSTFHPGSLGSMMFSGSPHHLHPIELASRNMYPHAGGNCMDTSTSPAHIGLSPPQQRCQVFHGRNPMIPLPSSFDGHNERIRGRRNDTGINQADNKKQYELDIERIVRGEDSRTTLMIKNIPNKYTSKMLLAAIDENHRGTYDFIYLPIDFKNKCNVGYAFINMIDPHHIIPFYQSFNGKKWEKFNSEKVASLAYARIQGKAALVAHFQNSSLMNEDKRCRPILFHSDGPNAGDQEPFPMGSNVRSRSGRSRTTSEENNHGSPTKFSHGDSDTAVSPPEAKGSE